MSGSNENRLAETHWTSVLKEQDRYSSMPFEGFCRVCRYHRDPILRQIADAVDSEVRAMLECEVRALFL